MFRSREYTNYTYDLSALNRLYLAWFVAEVAGAAPEEAARYIEELETDERLRAHIRTATQAHEAGRFADPEARYGRRLGWYAITRIRKPKLVVETGVDKGLGACVLTAALLRNRAEGHEGRYVGTDINPQAGYMLAGSYASAGEVRYGDSIASLENLEGPIDLFINDSDHTPGYEAREYDAVADKLADEAVVLGDNAHVSSELADFARKTGRRFLFFREEPVGHGYRGGAIGAAF